MISTNKHNNSSEEQAIVAYALCESYADLFQHMLEAVAENNCIKKADAHIALCVKFALLNGCNEFQVFNCYDTEDSEGNHSDFYLFRDHTRELTDYLDEKLNWDMRKSSITDKLIEKAVQDFVNLSEKYQFTI